MTDPTPTRDEAVRPYEMATHILRIAIEDRQASDTVEMNVGDLSVMLGLLLAPAPASGGVDAVLNLYREAVRVDVKMEGPQFMGANSSALKRAWEADRASLSPAATPVSEAGGWQDIKTAPKGRKVLVKFQSGEVEVCYQTDRGDGLMDNWRYAFARRGEQAPWPVEWCEIPLAKPATPAGGDVVEAHATKALMKAIQRAEDGAGTISAKEAVKLRPADWHAVCDRARKLAALSQSTSAGRGE